MDLGLGYLTVGQPSPSLSGGESQRVKLSRYLGRRSLAKKVIILDEPTTGLHPRDVGVLVSALRRLSAAGATVVVVEHNTDVIRAADWCLDLGPGSGNEGGKLLFSGPADELRKSKNSATAAAVRQEEAIRPRSRTPKRKSKRKNSKLKY